MNLTVQPALLCKGITKRFGSLLANDGIDFQILPGEIHGLIGENGAGKSTLMNVFYGVLQPDGGTIEINGEPVIFHSCADAMRMGIGMVFQHYLLVERFSVTNNVLLGREPANRGMLNARASAATVEALARRYGFSVDPSSIVEDLGVSARQQVELLRVLSRDPKIVILDEPTAALSPAEADGLFSVMDQLREQGRAVIFITHKLKEVMRVCDRITVLRKGTVCATVARENADPTVLASLMVGQLSTVEASPGAHATGPVVLDVSDLSVPGSHATAGLHRLTLRCRAGEIVGIAGVEGNGQEELAEAIFGLTKAAGGSIMLDGLDITNASVTTRRQAGIRYVPPDRQNEGLLLDLDAPQNALIGAPSAAPSPLLDIDLGRRRARRIAHDLSIADYDEAAPMRRYSGGTQQKFLVGRETSDVPRLLIVCAPTRGVDVSAAESIYARLLEMQAAGACIVLISYDLDEIRRLASRIIVFHGGAIAGELSPKQADDATLGRLMSGAAA